MFSRFTSFCGFVNYYIVFSVPVSYIGEPETLVITSTILREIVDRFKIEISQRKTKELFLRRLNWTIFLPYGRGQKKDVVIEEVLTDQIHCHILILNKIEQKKAPGNKDKYYQWSYPAIDFLLNFIKKNFGLVKMYFFYPSKFVQIVFFCRNPTASKVEFSSEQTELQTFTSVIFESLCTLCFQSVRLCERLTPAGLKEKQYWIYSLLHPWTFTEETQS